MRKYLFILPLLIGPMLQAQSQPVNGGFAFGLNLPVGDFATKKDSNGDYMGANGGAGVQIGGYVGVPVDKNSEFRFHLTFNSFVSDKQDIFDGNLYVGTRENEFNIIQLGGDYLYHVTSPRRGGYFLAGLNVNYVRAKAEFTYYANVTENQTGRIGARIGGGYHFNRSFSLEGQLNTVAVDKTDRGLDLNALTWLTINAVFKF